MENKPELILGAIGDWTEEASNDFTIENVFAGGRLVRSSAGYESSSIYLERLTSSGRKVKQALYGA